MSPRGLFFSVLAIAAINGWISPMLPAVYVFAPIWLPELFPKDALVIFYGATMIVSVSTLLIAGVPAAIFEGLTKRQETDRPALLIWLGGVALLTAPGVARFF
jgi:hypothetical protein